jgi:hypothetical protein|tara:strand:+ start:1248 stop:1385 length:138 start_codon:yes stop_codon:yes gene_type:complete
LQLASLGALQPHECDPNRVKQYALIERLQRFAKDPPEHMLRHQVF